MVAMELKNFFLALSADERDAFATKVASSVGHIQNVMYGFRPCAPDLAVRIEQQSKREVTRQELRPADWIDYWPELAKRRTKRTPAIPLNRISAEALADIELHSGGHNSPDQGHCLLEVVSMFSGEPFSASPACVDPVLAEFGRSWNDGLRSTGERAQLKRYIPLLPGTNKGPELALQRSWMAFDWLVRTHLPAWLDLSPALSEHAAKLRALDPITGQQGLDLALPALDHAARDSDAAWGAARAAARAAAWDATWGAAWGAAWAAARAAARAAAWAAARAAARTAAWDAAWGAARAAARAAAWAAAWDAARAAAPGGERAAADAVLEPTVQKLQASAHELYLDMINAELREIAAPTTAEA